MVDYSKKLGNTSFLNIEIVFLASMQMFTAEIRKLVKREWRPRRDLNQETPSEGFLG